MPIIYSALADTTHQQPMEPKLNTEQVVQGRSFSFLPLEERQRQINDYNDVPQRANARTQKMYEVLECHREGAAI